MAGPGGRRVGVVYRPDFNVNSGENKTNISFNFTLSQKLELSLSILPVEQSGAELNCGLGWREFMGICEHTQVKQSTQSAHSQPTSAREPRSSHIHKTMTMTLTYFSSKDLQRCCCATPKQKFTESERVKHDFHLIRVWFQSWIRKKIKHKQYKVPKKEKTRVYFRCGIWNATLPSSLLLFFWLNRPVFWGLVAVSHSNKEQRPASPWHGFLMS